jgi:hypothetical protein
MAREEIADTSITIKNKRSTEETLSQAVNVGWVGADAGCHATDGGAAGTAQ